MAREDTLTKSDTILKGNMEWLLNSDIRIKTPPNKGALYGWKILSPRSFPFIYSEITGYAITFFCWMAQEYGHENALDAAKEATDWIRSNLNSNLVFAKPSIKSEEPNPLSNTFYSFDNGMIVIGLLSLYKITKKSALLRVAQNILNKLIEKFFNGDKLIARLDKSFKPLPSAVEDGITKWSTVPGPYHCKLSIALLELAKITNVNQYRRISDSLCNYAMTLQGDKGDFITNPGSDVVYLHPHLYSCEGLIYSGVKCDNYSHYKAGIKGIKWALTMISDKGGIFRDSSKEVEQSDCTAQLLRLLILCRSNLEKSMDESQLTKTIDRLHLRLLDYYVPNSDGWSGMKYQFEKETICSWCTMFSAQALFLWKNKDSADSWLNYFV